ncbi:MAG: divalent-cation tolerance protein CutA [Deltaproteobacteria bacterium]|nr:divalent-cation tolerance protein CutA [Deltaproteobacteria bacterium]
MRLVVSTAPKDKALELARAVVEERLAACVNVLPGARSVYVWEGKICEDEESVLLMKTTDAGVALLASRVKELHPYDVPEIVSLEIRDGEGNRAYLDWIDQVVARR